MNTADHLSPDDLALFSLQFLPADELKLATEHMAHCEACRSEVGRMQGDLVSYAMTAELHSPPALARERLLRRVAKEKKLVPIDRNQPQAEPVLTSRNSLIFPTDTREEPAPRRGVGFMGWAGWAVAAGIAVAGGLQFHQKQLLQNELSSQSAKVSEATTAEGRAEDALMTLTDAGAMQVALHLPAPEGKPAAPKPDAHAAYIADKGALVFLASNLDPLQPYKTYELWLLPANGHDPIPAGTFKPDANGNATVVMPDLPKGIAAKGFGVTVEDDGGAKAPTPPIILAGM